jgi:hypothetical protein
VWYAARMSGSHLPLQYRPDGEPRVIAPAEVCDTCSDFERGVLVPVSFCDLAWLNTEEYYDWLCGDGARPIWLNSPDAAVWRAGQDG